MNDNNQKQNRRRSSILRLIPKEYRLAALIIVVVEGTLAAILALAQLLPLHQTIIIVTMCIAFLFQ